MRFQTGSKKVCEVTLADAVRYAHILRNASKFSFSDTLEINRKACSQEFIRLLDGFRWFDDDNPLFSDSPEPHLVTDLLIGLYGHPYHSNAEQHRRWKYTASEKKTPMYLDVFVFDQARCFYDFVPTLSFFADAMGFSTQLVVRACMDAICRNNLPVCPEWFHGALLADQGEPGFSIFRFPKRESITA